jgi:hypothetical protein
LSSNHKQGTIFVVVGMIRLRSGGTAGLFNAASPARINSNPSTSERVR